MSLTQEQALIILQALIAKPETNSEDVARIWDEVIGVYNKHFTAQPEEPKKRRRRRPTNPDIGWPAGVTRTEYKSWKEARLSQGVTEGLNPNEYKRLRDGGTLEAASKQAQPKEATSSPVTEFKKPASRKGKK